MTERQQRQAIKDGMRRYVDLGLPVIPLCSHDHKGATAKHIASCACAGKTPLVRGWAERTETTMPEVVSWIKEFETFNIGMLLGHPSGYVGVDVDGLLGQDMLDEMSGGDVPDTWSFRTGDGYRLLYEIPLGLKTKKFVNQNKNEEHTECSILAYGQQTVMPPSVHHTGRVYAWDEGHSPDDMDCAMAPEWLIELVTDDGTTSDSKSKAPKGTIDFTSNAPTYEAPDKEASSDTIEVNPILVTDSTLSSEFADFPLDDIDYRVPGEVKGKEAKGQEKKDEGVTPDMLTAIISEGGRDNTMTKIIGFFCAKSRSFGKEYIMNMAKDHNRRYCVPPLDDLSIEQKVNHIWEREEMKSAEFASKKSESDANKFAPPVVAQVVLNMLESKGMMLKAGEKDPVIWMTHKDHGPWIPYYCGGNADEFQEFIAPALMDPDNGGNPQWATRKNFGEVASSLMLMLKMQGRRWTVSGHDTNTQSLKGHDYIPLKDGKLLEWRTGKLLPWDPTTLLTYVVPVDYDPEAKCPAWERRLAQWLPDEETRMVVQEFLGYSMIPYMGFEKALLIQGEGANGKSMFLETLSLMFGREITASASMSFLFSKFGKRPLIGKILNIVNEAGADYLRGPNADDFKNMVSGGAVTADIKNQQPITFNNTAKFIFSANNDIKTSDKSNAWGRRIILVPFEQDFRNSGETKTDIMDEITVEFPGIFNWILEGLQRLMQNNRFTESEVIKKRMDDYLTSNDIAADFYANCLQMRPAFEVDGEAVGKGVAASAVTDLFKMWCEYRGNEVRKHAERIKEHLTKKKIKSARKTQKYLTLTDASKTSCWVNLDVHVTDPEFLEYICEEKIFDISNVKLKMYITNRLEEMNQEPTPPKPPVTSIPNTQAK